MGDNIDGVSITMLAKSQGIGRSKMRDILFEVIPKEETYSYSNMTIFPRSSVDKYFSKIEKKVAEAKVNKNKMKLPKKFIVGMANIAEDTIQDDALYSRRQIGTLCGVSSQTVRRVEERYIDNIYYKYEVINEDKRRFMGYEGIGIRKSVLLCRKIKEREEW